MPDFRGYSYAIGASKSVSVPQVTITGQVVDSTTGALIADFTGANALVFPTVVGTLSTAQQIALLNIVVPWLLEVKAGLNP